LSNDSLRTLTQPHNAQARDEAHDGQTRKSEREACLHSTLRRETFTVPGMGAVSLIGSNGIGLRHLLCCYDYSAAMHLLSSGAYLARRDLPTLVMVRLLTISNDAAQQQKRCCWEGRTLRTLR